MNMHDTHSYYVKPAASGSGQLSKLGECLHVANCADRRRQRRRDLGRGRDVQADHAGTDRSATFQLKNGVAVYGGFAGTETARNQRNPAANVTILSGDIDNNDSQTPIITDLTTVTGNTTNSYHVVTGATGATLDGFTITAGNANGAVSQR